MKKRIIAVLLAALTVIFLISVPAYAAKNASAEARSGVVRIAAEYDLYYKDDYLATQVMSLGSGFGVGKTGSETKYFVTNRHVIADRVVEITVLELAYAKYGQEIFEKYTEEELEALAEEVLVVDCIFSKAYILLDDFGYSKGNVDLAHAVECSLIYAAGTNDPDLAIIEAETKVKGRMALPLADQKLEDRLEVRDTVVALGYPGSSDIMASASAKEERTIADVEDVTVTSGTISAFPTMGKASLIQHTATINHGNSGGPLIDENGAVLGVNTYNAGMDASTGDSNAYYSIRAKHVRDILDKNKIPYELYKKDSGFGTFLTILVIAAAIAAAVVFLKKKKESMTAVQPAGNEPSPAPSAAPAPKTDPQDTWPRIQGVSGVFAGQRFSFDKRIRLGRKPDANDVVFPEDTQGVSGIHCVIIRQDDQLFIEDLGSSYGTFVGQGNRLAASSPLPVTYGDVFWLGSEKEKFVITKKGGNV